jgi:hypothetical protein
LALYPEVQKRIQDELDEHIGDGRRPTMKDIDNLVYFKAAWNESMRFNVTTPIGMVLYVSEACLVIVVQEFHM